MRLAVPFACFLCTVAAGCGEEPPLTLTVDKTSLEADGLTRAHLTVHVRDPVERAVVQLTADGGALTTSSVPLVDQEASLDLIAPLEKELGRRARRTITVAAAVAIDKATTLTAKTTITAVPPKDGPPILFLDATPPAAVAGSGGTVAVDVLARRVAPGTALAVSADGAEVVDAAPVVGDDGSAAAAVRVPPGPVDAVVTVGVPGTTVSSSLVIRFVKDGDPLYDLTGAFVQIGPARVKLASGALVPNPQCAVAPSIVLAQFVQTGLSLDASYTTCDVAFPPVTSLVGTVTDHAPPSFYAAIPVVTKTFSLDTGELGAVYAPQPTIVVVGANLDDPAHDPLPTDASDPRVVDADGDGQPGVTVQNSLGGDQHIVFRNIGQSRGKVVSSNLVRGDDPGDLEATTETSVFGIGGAFLPNTQALGSVVELVRIDGRYGAVNADADGDGTITCAEALDVAGALDDLEPPDTPFDCGADK